MNQMILYGGVADPPFQAVISQYPWWQPYKDSYTQQRAYDILQSETGCSDLSCLQSLNITTLGPVIADIYTIGYAEGVYGMGDFLFRPVVDGVIIQGLPQHEFQQGHFTKVPLLVDHDGYEGVLFSNTSETTHAEENIDLETIFPNALPSFFTRLYELYSRDDFNSTFYQRQTIFGDISIDCSTYYMASMAADYGLDVYKLRFFAGTELHGASGAFVFSPYINPTGNNATLAHIIRDYYISFAVKGNPNTASYSGVPKPTWKKYTATNERDLDVNYTTIGMVPDYDVGPRCDFISGQSYAVRN